MMNSARVGTLWNSRVRYGGGVRSWPYTLLRRLGSMRMPRSDPSPRGHTDLLLSCATSSRGALR